MFPRKLTRQVVCDLDNPVVQTKAGKLRGVIVEDAYIFRGIRYAEAERFHMPRPVTPWEGIRDAITYGPVCMEQSTPIAHDAYNVPHYYFPQDENCQYLNVWTQAINEDRKRPVMLWIHGGGFTSGSSVELYAYDGEELSKYGDVVVVSLNHRLNLLGFMDLSAYGEEYKYSGNVGMADIVAALEWIRDNISAFGGDPQNVTIMGQSGGGIKVTDLLQMPAADGLFHRAIVQSGTIANGLDVPQKDAQALSARVLTELGIAPENIKEIEKVPYYKLARAVQKANEYNAANGGRSVMFAPVVDYDYYMGYGPVNGFRKETLHIPMIVGSVFGESANNFNNELEKSHKNEWDADKRASFMKDMYGDYADEVLRAFKKAFPKRSEVDALFYDTGFRSGAKVYVKKRAEAGAAPVYNYAFNLECPLNGGTAPWHNAEEAYMFHNACYLEASYIPGVSEQLENQMAGAWVQFAKTGDPNIAGLPVWPEVTPDSIPTMAFDRECEIMPDYDDELLPLILKYRKPRDMMGARRRSRSILGGGPRQAT